MLSFIAPTKSFVVKVYGPEFDQVECELKELTRDSRECTFTPTQEGKVCLGNSLFLFSAFIIHLALRECGHQSSCR